MNNKVFAAKCIEAAQKYDTLYVKGCFGAPLNAKNKKRYTTNTEYNARADRKAKIEAASPNTFGFDCVCLIKGILWGWKGDASAAYGGASYKTNGVPDIGPDAMIQRCADVSTDFSEIEIGEAVWMSGHIGVYVGNGLAVECTPRWEDKVQITACNRSVEGYNRRNWTKHGKLPWVEYEAEETFCTVSVKVLKRGNKGNDVKALQALLLNAGCDLKQYGADGSFGGVTETAVRQYQKEHGITADGIAGKETFESLLK